MSARSLIGQVVLAALVAAGAAACKQEAAAPKPAPSTAGDDTTAVAPQGDETKRGMRAKMPPLPHRGRDGKIVDLQDRKMPWADGERPTREQLMERRDQRRKDMLAAFDADSDGQLSAEEREMMRETRVSGLVDKMDADRDGRISKTELEDMRSQTRRPLPEFDKLDTDKDGFVTVEEMAKNRPPPGERGGRRGRPDGDGAAPATPPADDPPLTK